MSDIECQCKPQILIVDDNQFNLIPILELIKKTYHISPLTCENGEEAVELYKK